MKSNRRERYRPDRKSVDSRQNQKASFFDSILAPGVKAYQSRAGINVGRILPQFAPKPDWQEEPHFGIDVWVHYGVGPDSGTYLCRFKMLGEPCAACDERRRLQDDDDKEAAYQMSPKKSVAYWWIDRDHEDEGPMIHRWGYTYDQDLATRTDSKRTGAILDITDEEEGYDISFRKGKENPYPKITSIDIDRDPSPICDDQRTQDKWLDYVEDHPLDLSLFKFYPNKYIEDLLYGRGAPEETEDAPRSSRRGRDEPDDAPRSRRGARDEEPEEQPRRARRDREAPEEEEDAPRSRRRGRDEPEETPEADEQPSSRRRGREEPEVADPEEERPRSRNRGRDAPEPEEETRGRRRSLPRDEEEPDYRPRRGRERDREEEPEEEPEERPKSRRRDREEEPETETEERPRTRRERMPPREQTKTGKLIDDDLPSEGEREPREKPSRGGAVEQARGTLNRMAKEQEEDTPRARRRPPADEPASGRRSRR